MISTSRLHFVLAPEDCHGPLAEVWREMLPSLNRRRWAVVCPGEEPVPRVPRFQHPHGAGPLEGFDGAHDGIAVLPSADGSIPAADRIRALHEEFPSAPIYRLWRTWPAYEPLYP